MACVLQMHSSMSNYKEAAMRHTQRETTRTSPRITPGLFRVPLAAFFLLAAGGAAEAQQRTQCERPVRAAVVRAETRSAIRVVENAQRRIVVSIPDRMLVLLEDGIVVKMYRVAVGTSASPSPSGSFQVTTRIPDPTYYAPGIIEPPGPKNPLGTRWIGVTLKGYGIHGTNDPGSIGKRASHGCIRMRNEDVEDLFERVRTGDWVEWYSELPVELAAHFAPQAPARAAETVAAEDSKQAVPVAVAMVQVKF